MSDFTSRDELLRREAHRNASMAGRRPHTHRYSPQDLESSPSSSPVEHVIQRAATQPDLASYALKIGHYNRQSVPSDLKFRADPRRETPRATLPYPEPQRQLVPRVPPPRTNFTIGEFTTLNN